MKFCLLVTWPQVKDAMSPLTNFSAAFLMSLSLYTLLRMLSKGFLLVLCQVNDVVQCQSLAVKEFFVVPFVEHAIKVVFTQITKKVCSYFRFLRLRLWWCIVHC